MDSFARIALLGTLAMSSACTLPELEAPVGDPDAGVEAPDPDASEATQLVVGFEADPEIPFADDGAFEVEVDGVHLSLEDVRAIGDAGATRPAAMTLDWNDVLVPSPYVAKGAAPGMYSQMRATVAGYEVYGSVKIAGKRVPFEIEDKPIGLGLDMPLIDCVVEAGQIEQTPVVFRSDEIIGDIPWDTLVADPDGVLRIGAANPDVLDIIREHLGDSFEEDD